MKILVTGGSGFIGSRFLEKFATDYDFTIFTLEKTTRLIVIEIISKITNNLDALFNIFL